MKPIPIEPTVTYAALEHTALEVGEALILARVPHWAKAYRKWRARFGGEP